MDFVGGIKQLFSWIQPKRDGDLIDRLNYGYTTVILICCVMFETAYYFGSLPIKCWFPAYFKGFWIEYALDYCFVKNTYFVPMFDGPHETYFEAAESYVQVRRNVTVKGQYELTYYQWVPFILAMQALCFFIPVLVWRTFNNTSGLFINHILLQSSKADNLGPEVRKKHMDDVANYMDYSRQCYSKLKTHGLLTGRYVLGLYMFVKLLYVINIVGQFFIMNAFLGFGSYAFWGFGVLNDLVHGRSWEESGHFPRVSLCSFQIREEVENVHRHTVQCTLHINMFNEKIFLVLWWWFLFVAICTVLNFLHWIFILAIPTHSQSFVSTYLRKIDDSARDPRTTNKMNRFLNRYLMADGVLMLRLISCNAGDIVCADLMRSLWEKFKQINATTPRTPRPERNAISSPTLTASTSSPIRNPDSDTMPFLPPPRYDEMETAKRRNGTRESE